MRFCILLAILISTSSYACIPCDEDATVEVVYQALPKFQTIIRSKDGQGRVKFKMNASTNGIAQEIEFLELYPENTPKESILDMIKRTKFRVVIKPGKFGNCGAENITMELEYLLPQSIEIDSKIEIVFPKIELNKKLQNDE